MHAHASVFSVFVMILVLVRIVRLCALFELFLCAHQIVLLLHCSEGDEWGVPATRANGRAGVLV